MTNRKGYGSLGFVILFLFLLIMWPFVFAPMFTISGTNAIANGATGLEAFLWNNLNLWFGIMLLIIVVVYIRYSGGG